MKLVFCYFSFLLLGSVLCRTKDLLYRTSQEDRDLMYRTRQDDMHLLYRTLDALTRGLSYVEKVIHEVNFDAVFCVRRVEEQLQAFLEFQPDLFKSIRYWVEGLRRRAKRTADTGREIMYKTVPRYAKGLGFLLSQNKKLIWYRSLITSKNATVEPKPCAEWNGTFSDLCFSQLSETDGSTGVCRISEACMQHYQDMRQRGYSITHQVLFWEMLEARKCVDKVSRQLRTDFCSNVMRDTKQAEIQNFPPAYQDLFMEQIGLCGIWGFRDFYKRNWLNNILEWQLSSGCYSNPGRYKCEEQLQSFLIHQPEVFVGVRRWLEVLRDKAKDIADKGLQNVYLKEPKYASGFGRMINASKNLVWYPSQETSNEYEVERVNCSVFFYDIHTKSHCYQRMIGSQGKDCDVSPMCYAFNERYHQRDYDLTHQVLFWISMEAHDCVDNVSEERRRRLCSNVLRDAKEIAAAHFPQKQNDLFMEQVGLCGFWGFSDFNQPEWLEKILDYQDSSGCYKLNNQYYTCMDPEPEKILSRVKRREQVLSDGCYSHCTAVAITALVVNIRFEAEKLHKQSTVKDQRLNALLN